MFILISFEGCDACKISLKYLTLSNNISDVSMSKLSKYLFI